MNIFSLISRQIQVLCGLNKRNPSSAARKFGLLSWPYHLLTLWLWTIYLNCLSLSLPNIAKPDGNLMKLWELNQMIHIKQHSFWYIGRYYYYYCNFSGHFLFLKIFYFVKIKHVHYSKYVKKKLTNTRKYEKESKNYRKSQPLRANHHKF